MEGPPKKKTLNGSRGMMAALALGSLPAADTAPRQAGLEPEVSSPASTEPSLRQSLLDANILLFPTKASDLPPDPTLKPMEDVAQLVPRSEEEDRVPYADRIARISRYLAMRELPLTVVSIAEAERNIEVARERFAEYPVFQQRTLLAAGVDTELHQGERWAKFTSQDLKDVLHDEAPRYETFSGLNSEYQATPDSAVHARDRVLDAIANAREDAITVMFNAHGAEDRIFLGKVGPNLRAPREELSNIAPEDLAAVFIRRHEITREVRDASRTPDVLILANCYSGDFALSFIQKLNEAGAPIPIIITATESGQLGTIMFQHDISDLGKKQDRLRMRDLMEHMSRTDLNVGANPIIFVPDSEEPTKPLQVTLQDKNSSTSLA